MTRPPLFAAHPIVATDDPQLARERVGEVFVEHRLRLPSRDDEIHLVHNGVELGGVGIHYMRYGGRVRVSPEPLGRLWLVQVPVAGGGIDRVDGDEIDVGRRLASITAPDAALEMEWAPDTAKIVVAIERARFESALEAVGGTPPPAPGHASAPSALPMDATASRGWFRLLRTLTEEVDENGALAADPIVAERFADAIVFGLASAMHNTGTDDEEAPARRVDAALVQRVVERLHGDPARAWRLDELAAAERVSARALADAFHRSVDSSPMQYLRRLRLEGAREELRTADPASETTARIATNWGFAHLGRFADDYRAAFGELPSQTLRT